ncbi:phosphogluconate dehydratase [Niveibacterium sp. SC-1]|uniref:phosphogluconate dehydratase n=1 Tax=Niveibacterium sp. SC-1 TaxID=3135646 RepID=UPI00311F6555
MSLHPGLLQVTERIRRRSAARRARYLSRLASAPGATRRSELSCTNLAHAFAASPSADRILIKEQRRPNLGIVTAYNDMLSAHQPLRDYPEWIKEAAREAGATAQVAGGVPAMCDGVTQGQPGMELSLFSRDVIAMSTAIALTHNMFDAALYLGVCDKIVPGLMIGALRFGHLPAVFVPAGPMPSGMPNEEKSKVRQRYAAGEIGKDVLLEAESRAYHAAGTCTFYGTANSNQMLMEVMGLHLPGAAFVPPGTPLRHALTLAAGRRAAELALAPEGARGVGHMIDERSIVNALVGLLATGGSTNHTLHLVAIAHAAGIEIDWDDFDDLSRVVPLLARVYPNGSADVNQFHAAGGMAFLIRELRDAGLLHDDVATIAGVGLDAYTKAPALDASGRLVWVDAPGHSLDGDILRPADDPFSADGGLRVLKGRLGRSVIKVSAVKPEHRLVEAPVRVFGDQAEVQAAAKRGELDRDVIVVVRFQGPRANGMPELHKLTPTLANLQDKGFKVALVTDGRMSGASGKVPAAIHVTPEAACDGPIARLRDGDVVRLDAVAGVLDLVGAEDFETRAPAETNLETNEWGLGRELFGVFRRVAAGAEAGGSVFGFED